MAANNGTLERRKAKVFEYILTGAMSDAQVALALSTPKRSVTPQAITAFRERHATELAQVTIELIEEVKHRWIADKDARLGKLENIYDGLEEVKETYGFMVTTEEAAGKEGERVIYDQHFNGQLAAQMRGVLSDAADELGQKPKTPVNVNIDNRTQQVFVRQVIGPQVELG